MFDVKRQHKSLSAAADKTGDPLSVDGHTHGVTEQPLPSRGEGDSDESWGDEPQDNEERLDSERPPHHDDRG